MAINRTSLATSASSLARAHVSFDVVMECVRRCVHGLQFVPACLSTALNKIAKH